MATLIFCLKIYATFGFLYLCFFAYFTKWIMGTRYQEWREAIIQFNIQYDAHWVLPWLIIGYLFLALNWPYLVWKLILREWRKARAA